MGAESAPGNGRHAAPGNGWDSSAGRSAATADEQPADEQPAGNGRDSPARWWCGHAPALRGDSDPSCWWYRDASSCGWRSYAPSNRWNKAS